MPSPLHLPSLPRRALLNALAGSALACFGVARAAPANAVERWTLAADFDPAAAVWMGFAHGHDDITAALAKALQPQVKLKFMLRDEAHAERLRALLGRHGLATASIEFHYDDAAGYFMRDLAVFARGAGGRRAIVDFRSSLYGTPTWCRHRHAEDDDAVASCTARGLEVAGGRTKVDRTVARLLRAQVHATPLSAEGGGVETNGRGVLLANAPLWASRNPELTREQIHRALLALPGIRKVIWLEGGLAEDAHLRSTITGDHVAWGSGGHTDQFVRFVDERTVLLAWPDDGDAVRHPVARLTRLRMQRNFELLRTASDAHGRPLRVLKLPMPAIIEREVTLHEGADTAWSHEWTAADFPVREGRRQGDRVTQVATATYMNFVVANGALVLPDYLPHGTRPEVQQAVRRIFESVLPGRTITWVDPITANWVGGGLHCATVNEPAAG